MNDLVHVYRAHIRFFVQQQLQYRAELSIWLIARVLNPVIYLLVWSAVARANGGAVNALSERKLVAYFLAELLVNFITDTTVIWEYEYRVRNGKLSMLLLHPLHPIHVDLAENIATKAVNSLTLLPTFVLLIWLFKPAWHISFAILLFALPALLLAYALRFLAEWMLAMAAFWTTRVSALNQSYIVVLLFLSGQIAPLALLPQPLQVLATLSPFRWMLAFPIAMITDQLTLQARLTGLLVQGCWLIVLLLLCMSVWHLGVRHYSAVEA